MTRIRELRKQKSISVEKLAEVLDISVPYLYDIETGRRRLHEDLIKKLCNYFKVSADSLLSRNDNGNGTTPYYQVAESSGIYAVGPTVKIPVIGTIRAGEPLFADQNITGYEDVSISDVKDGKYFFLEVIGESMIGSRIYPGDRVLVRCQEYVEDNQIAVVLIEEEVTLKRIKFINETVILYPDNPHYQTQIYKTEEIKILGIVKKVIFVP